jgi:hypothetical protein
VENSSAWEMIRENINISAKVWVILNGRSISHGLTKDAQNY